MEQNSDVKNAFLTVLEQLKNEGYLREGEAGNVKAAYSKYVEDLKQKNAASPSPPPVSQSVPVYPASPVSPPFPAYRAYPDDISPRYPSNPAYYGNSPVYKPEPEKRTLTKEEISERNITYILNIGVVLILLSGLIFGTTTWEIMNNAGKVVLLCSASAVLFIVSIIAKAVLKIPKSSSAFWILGSLLFPISLLSIGYFRLFGDYLSFFGEGRYQFGLICALLCLPLYIWSACRSESRTFSWITLVNITLIFVFSVLSFHPANVLFSLLLLGYNLLLLIASFMIKNTKRFSLFFNELPLFLQFNLILSTVIALALFDSAYLYSVNILFASALFFALSLSQKKGGYDYVFGLLFTLGMFLLSRKFQSPAAAFMAVPITGFLFTGLSFLADSDASRGIKLQIFSGISTLLGFVYVSAMLVPLNSPGDYAVGLISLALITANFIFLSFKTNKPFFGIMAPFQCLAISYLFSDLLKTFYFFRHQNELLLFSTILVFVLGYWLNRIERLNHLKYSSLAAALLNTAVVFLISSLHKPELLNLSVISFIFTAQVFILSRKAKDESLKTALNILLSFLIFGSLYLIRTSYSLTGILPHAFAFFCALLTFLLHFVPIKKLADFRKMLFYCGHTLMAIIFLNILITNKNGLVDTAILFILGIAYLYSVAVTKTREKILWFYAALVTSTVIVFHVFTQVKLIYQLDLMKYWLFVAGYLLLALYFIIRKTELSKHVPMFLCVVSVMMIYGSLFAKSMLWYEYAAEIAFAALLCLSIFLSELRLLPVFPLALIFTANHVLVDVMLKGSGVSIPFIVIWFIVLLAVGFKRYLYLFDFERKDADWFGIFALLCVFHFRGAYVDFDVRWLISMLPGLTCSIWFFINRSRLFDNYDFRIGSVLFALSLLWPYYSLLGSGYGQVKDYIYELVLLPLVLLTYICVKWICFGVKNSFLSFAEYFVPAVAYTILLSRLYYADGMTHGLIIGIAGLVSLLYASLFRTKSALIYGCAVILVSVFIETRTFWFSIQWWVYLLVLGLILVAVASFNEYQKNKDHAGVVSRINGFLDKFSDWN